MLAAAKWGQRQETRAEAVVVNQGGLGWPGLDGGVQTK